MYPRIRINLKKYEHNLRQLTMRLAESNLSVMAVSKVFCADQKLIDVISKTNIEYIGDSRIENIAKMKTDKKKVLLRIPQLCELDSVIKYADISLNSELKIIKELDAVANKQGKRHGIILMFDIGDLREGIYYQSSYLRLVEQILELKYIQLAGIGTNLTCYGGVIPEEETLEKLEKIKEEIEKEFKFKLDIISGGNSSSLKLALKQKLPDFINNLRIGETFVLGRETAYGEQISGLYDDVFILEAQVIELKMKPSMPQGTLSFDAFGKKVEFTDHGEMKRAILAIGRQDVNCEDLTTGLEFDILGCSSDHLIINDKENVLSVGGIVSFKPTYGGILSLMTSKYVRRLYDKTI